MFKQNCASMLYAFHVICILQQSPRLPCLTIDNRLTHTVNDCYSRISIGTKVPDVNSTLRLSVASLTECEENCSTRGNNCVAFSFGVGIKGNSTCLIGAQIPTLENLQVHPEYDVYVKKRQGSPWCDFHHFISVPRYTPPSSSREERILSADYSREPLGLVPIKNERTTSTRSSALDCHRKTQPSKKVTDLLIERIVSCENVQDCCQTCNYERSFVCKGFNHRRGTADSECTCELTSTPYFRMNVAQDFLIDSRYDYYEKNANCPPSTRPADDLLNRRNYIEHYSQGDRRTLSAVERVSKDIFRESTTETNRVYTRDYYSYDHLPLDHQRNNEESFDVASRPNALSWNRNWKGAGTRYSALVNENIVSSRNENHDKEYLESNLGYDRPAHQSSSIPNKDEHFYQQLYTYDDTFDQRTNSEQQQGSRASRRCSAKAVSGARLNRGVVRKTCMAHDFSKCEHFCTHETSFSCESFAYRYRVITSNPANNCLLSDHSYRDLNFYTDLEPDRDYDSYVITSDADICHGKKSTSRYPFEECFSRIRSGFTIPMAITKKSLFVDNLGDCQFACTRSEEFACKCFVYKYAPAIRGRGNEDVSSNCFLTDWSPEQINPIDMPDMDDAELYERSTFPYGCDFYSPPISIPNVIGSTRNGERDSRTRMDEFCYSEHHAPCKLTPHAVMFSTRTITKSECRQKCSTMRRTDTTPCMSFDYANATPADIDGARDNCFLTDISVRDLRPNLDYVHDHDHTLYTWNDYDPRCNFNAADAANVTPTFHEHVHSFIPASHANPSKTNFGDEKFHEGGPEYVPINEQDAPLFESADDGRNEHNIFYPRVQHSSLRRYTVNGHPCKNATVCQRNQITGFWSCETENMHGTWDYCCEPNHQCGYSKGYHHPWCYVGSNENQWRPCSDTYYPYYVPKDRSSYPRSTLYSGRHWPVIYFHRTSPPNCSTNDPYRETSPTLL